MERLRRALRRPLPSVVLAAVALFVALGGASYAAVLVLKPGGVTTADLHKGAVTNSKLANGAVTAAKVKKHSLLGSDFASGQLPRGAPGASGRAGVTGAAGA